MFHYSISAFVTYFQHSDNSEKCDAIANNGLHRFGDHLAAYVSRSGRVSVYCSALHWCCAVQPTHLQPARSAPSRTADSKCVV